MLINILPAQPGEVKNPTQSGMFCSQETLGEKEGLHASMYSKQQTVNRQIKGLLQKLSDVFRSPVVNYDKERLSPVTERVLLVSA